MHSSDPRQPKVLLICQNEGCHQEFTDEIDERLEGDAASLPAALKAHKAGWQLADNKIFCPRCAQNFNKPA